MMVLKSDFNKFKAITTDTFAEFISKITFNREKAELGKRKDVDKLKIALKKIDGDMILKNFETQ